MIKESDAVTIARKYAEELGLTSYIMDGCMLSESGGSPCWLVFLRFPEDHFDEFKDVIDGYIGLPSSLAVAVDAVTGEPSHIPHL
jgi:hypothetical protein